MVTGVQLYAGFLLLHGLALAHPSSLQLHVRMSYLKDLISQLSVHQQRPISMTPTPTKCDCTGTNDTGPSGSAYVCNDPRLGPLQLPTVFPLLSFVSDYDRFGGHTPGDFLAKWTDPETGFYNYPPENGFQLDVDKKPIKGNMVLLPGTEVDRFGSEYGRYLSILIRSCSVIYYMNDWGFCVSDSHYFASVENTIATSGGY